jgi:hypothetical protein
MIKINRIINNIMQDPMVVISKIIINQIKITNITSKVIITILDFNRIMSYVIVFSRKVMLGMNFLYRRKLLRKRKRTPN